MINLMSLNLKKQKNNNNSMQLSLYLTYLLNTVFLFELKNLPCHFAYILFILFVFLNSRQTIFGYKTIYK